MAGIRNDGEGEQGHKRLEPHIPQAERFVEAALRLQVSHSVAAAWPTLQPPGRLPTVFTQMGQTPKKSGHEHTDGDESYGLISPLA